MHDGQGPSKLPSGVRLLPVRELAAIVEEGEYRGNEAGIAEIERHLEVVTAVFAQDAVLPAPVGTVFRSEDVLQKWMELHYVAVSDALAWVEDRLAARVHIIRGSGREGDKDAGSDLDRKSVV